MFISKNISVGTAARRPLRIGVYAGVFDPVHAGHIKFALQAMQAAGLDQVVFLPERQPRHKAGVSHFAHRVAMLKRAIRPYPDMAVLELVERRFSVTRTLPALQVVFGDSQLVLLTGSDAALGLPDWPYAAQLLQQVELIVGVRSAHSRRSLVKIIKGWPWQPVKLHIIESMAADVSSSGIRQALRAGDGPAHGLLLSVRRYAGREWLYVSPAKVIG